MNRFFISIIIAALFMLPSVSCKKKGEVETSPPNAGDKAPAFTLKDINGKNTGLAEYSGKVILLEFWATWCPPCKELTPVIQRLYSKYKDRGFVVLSVISADEGEENIKKFVAEHNIKYTVLLGDSDIINRYGATRVPMTFLIKKGGEIANIYLGNTPGIAEELDSAIDKLL